MEKLLQKLKNGLSDGLHTLSEKTEEMTKIGRLKLEIIAIKRDIERAMIELGGRVYQRFKDKKILDDPDVKLLVKKIKEKEDKLKAIEEKIEQVKKLRDISTGSSH